MDIRQTFSRLVVLVTLGALLALSWASSALAQVQGDGDGPDGDELVLPILLGAAVLAFIGWSVVRGRSRKSS